MSGTAEDSANSGESLSPLFHDYLFDFTQVAPFYPAGAPFELERLAARAAALDYPAERRAAMAAELARQNPGNTVEAGRFDEPGTAAILTGQQAGLLGGPLLGVFKAMTAVLIAERLRARGTAAVPIFWMATQDHDLVEVNQAWVPDGNDELHRLSADFNGSAAAGHAIGSLRLNDTIRHALEEAERSCEGDWSAVRAAYQPGATLAEAFGGLLRRWFAPWGLLVFDPRCATAAGLWQPYYVAAFDRQAELAGLLGERGAGLAASGYHVQVEQTGAASMLFLEEPEGRRGLRRGEHGWLIGETPVEAAALRARVAGDAVHVSAAALLRPVLQDVAFPTVAQVTGPAEIAYLAQSAVLYQALGVSQPVAWPRARATLVDAKAQRLLQKYGITLTELREAGAGELLARRALPAGIREHAAALRAQTESGLQALGAELQQLDPTLVDAVQGAGQKIEHQLQQLETRVVRSLARRSGELGAQARHLDAWLVPEGQPQERVLSAAAVIARNPALLERLYGALDPDARAHQQIQL
ncbi:MAG: bacillithiol biosynthesis cysteine-adding enzyme BshC [Terriglobales bacterium]